MFYQTSLIIELKFNIEKLKFELEINVQVTAS